MQAHSFRTLGVPYYDNAVIEAFIGGGCGGWSVRTPGYASHMNVPRTAPGLQKATVHGIFAHPDFARRGMAKAIMAAIEAANFTTAAGDFRRAAA